MKKFAGNKRARNPPGTSSPAAKRIKEDPKPRTSVEEPESVFAAARRRHQERQKAEGNAVQETTRGPAAAATSANSLDSHEAWEKRWMRIYPNKQLVRAVGAVF